MDSILSLTAVPGSQCFKVILPDSWKVLFDSTVFGLERSPLSLVRTTKELLEGKSSGSRLENRD
jgi:hypothetical protein